MPTYEYACPKCGHQFEQFQSMRDEPLRKCPKCSKSGLKRLIGGGAGLIFKGSGFYITDYKKKSGSPSGEPKENSGPGGGGGESAPKASTHTHAGGCCGGACGAAAAGAAGAAGRKGGS